MDPKASRKGSCLCGNITLRIEGDPSMKVLCHCDSCQKSSGAVFQANAFYPKEVLANEISWLRETITDNG
jgi:hypothetical protein